MTGDEGFLTVTFDGGRFVEHTMPVTAMGEFATLERLLTIVGRELFLQRNPNRHRVDAGFTEAATLHFVTSEHNCFSARLERPGAAASAEMSELFTTSRELVLDALIAVQGGSRPGAAFPAKALHQLATVGKLLDSTESLALLHAGRSAHVDRTTRKRLAELTHQVFEFVGVIEGEVIEIHDAQARCIIRQSDLQQVEVPFEPASRAAVMEAMQARPLMKARVKGTIVQSSPWKMKHVEELEVVETERAGEVRQMQERVSRLRDVPDGWLEGEGLAPAASLLEHAMRVLSRLMVEVPTLPKPALFPTPDGGVQAEWMVATWSLDAHFLPDNEEIAMSAVQAATTVEHDRTFSRSEVTTENVHALGAWVNDTIVGNLSGERP